VALGRRKTIDESKLGEIPLIEEVDGFSNHSSEEGDHDVTMKPDKGYNADNNAENF
jgi:hypothetical protein